MINNYSKNLGSWSNISICGIELRAAIQFIRPFLAYGLVAFMLLLRMGMNSARLKYCLLWWIINITFRVMILLWYLGGIKLNNMHPFLSLKYIRIWIYYHPHRRPISSSIYRIFHWNWLTRFHLKIGIHRRDSRYPQIEPSHLYP